MTCGHGLVFVLSVLLLCLLYLFCVSGCASLDAVSSVLSVSFVLSVRYALVGLHSSMCLSL